MTDSRWAFTGYFESTRQRPDRVTIDIAWVIRTVDAPEHQRTQADGRFRYWRRIPEADGR